MPDISNSYYSQSTTGDRLENRSFNNDVAYLELDTYLADYADLTINCGTNGCSPTEPGIDTYNFIATTKSNRDVYTNLFNIQYKKLTSTWTETQLDTISILNAGDHFIPHFDVLEAFYENSSPIVSFVSTPLVYNKNLEFRNYSTLERGKFTWYKYQGGYDHKSLARHMAFKYYELVADEGEFFPEYYSLSDKYNTQLPDNIYFPIPFNYNLCKDCIEDMPYRVYYSELDNEEQSNDSLRIIKANNYTNILGEHGPIKNLLVSRNKLFLTTDNTSMFLPTKPQSLQTNDNSIFIGTGEVLSLPPQYLSETSYPIGGCPSFKHVNVNEFGAVYIDPKSERVFLITDSLSDLSSNGLRNFWKENGEVKFLNQFKKLTNQEYEHTQLTHPYGVGYVITFDPRFKRVIIHKRDYEFLSNQLSVGIDITTPNVF